MVYYPPARDVMCMEPPDSCTVDQFIFDEQYGRRPFEESLDPYTCALSGRTYTASKTRERVDFMSRALAKEMGWSPNKGSEYDKVACIYAFNTVDTCNVYWAIHRNGGIATPANAAYNADELEYQLKISNATAIFTTVLNLDVALAAAQKRRIPKDKIFIIELPETVTGGKPAPGECKQVNDMVEAGAKLPKLESVKYSAGEGKKRTAYLCFSSGTSGLPKGVMISHFNVIANIITMHSHDIHYRAARAESGKAEDVVDRKLCLLPLSHIYGLVLIGHHTAWAGDQNVILPNFKMDWMLQAIQDYKLLMLYLVPPIIIGLTRNKDLASKYDLSSVGTVMTGAAPMGAETGDELLRMLPKILIRQAYGMTETSTCVFHTAFDDIVQGSTGCVLPGVKVKIVDPTSLKEITEYEKPGELWVSSPSNTLGYLNNEKSTKETFVWDDGDYWVRTGDEVMAKKTGPKGNEHFYIVDRIKELIKVKGHQVAPAELEAHLLSHPSVGDCAVIPIPDDRAGERPKAFVVKSKNVGLEDNDRMVAREIRKFVEKHKSEYKWVKEVEFIDVIPKSPSGKILRRLLRDKDREKRRQQGAKL